MIVAADLRKLAGQYVWAVYLPSFDPTYMGKGMIRVIFPKDPYQAGSLEIIPEKWYQSVGGMNSDPILPSSWYLFDDVEEYEGFLMFHRLKGRSFKNFRDH